MAFINDCVGKDGQNDHRDVMIVQQILSRHPDSPNRLLTVDGHCGSQTLDCILAFQAGFMDTPDGRVVPFGDTICRLWPRTFANPTGKCVRQRDRYGSGHFKAPDARGLRLGTDYTAAPGQIVRAIMAGRVVEVFQPYQDGIDATELQGVVVESSGGARCAIWHLTPLPGILGKLVRASDTVGHARSLQNRHPGITDHIHVQLSSRWGERLDPATLIR